MTEKKLKEKYLHIRIDEDTKNEVAAAAADMGLTLSALINMLVKKWLKEQK